MKKVIILRGPQGSGKTTLCNKLIQSLADVGFINSRTGLPPTYVICSADHYWTRPDGSYHWSKEEMGGGHIWCFWQFRKAIANEVDIIIIDNVNRRFSDASEYVKYGVAAGYEIEVQEPDNAKPWNAQQLCDRNKATHKVPYETIKRIIDSWMPLSDFQACLNEAVTRHKGLATQTNVKHDEQRITYD